MPPTQQELCRNGRAGYRTTPTIGPKSQEKLDLLFLDVHANRGEALGRRVAGEARKQE